MAPLLLQLASAVVASCGSVHGIPLTAGVAGAAAAAAARP